VGASNDSVPWVAAAIAAIGAVIVAWLRRKVPSAVMDYQALARDHREEIERLDKRLTRCEERHTMRDRQDEARDQELERRKLERDREMRALHDELRMLRARVLTVEEGQE
jgi:hypothetical protein